MVDAPYLTPADIRDRVPDLVDDSRFPDDLIEELVASFEQLAERYRGCAFTTRTVTAETYHQAGSSIVLAHPLVQSVSTLSLDGDPLTGEQLLDLGAGILEYPGGFGCGTVAVTYTHGHLEPPPAVLRACRLFVWREAMADANPNSGNSYVTTNTDLGVVERASTADWAGGRPTGWLDVDRILNGLPDLRTPGIA